MSQVIPAKSHSKKGIEETLFRVILRGLPKDDEIHRILGVIKSANDSFSGDKEFNVSKGADNYYSIKFEDISATAVERTIAI